jgi:hypothetical protein
MLPVSWREVGIPYKCPETTKLRISWKAASVYLFLAITAHCVRNSRLTRRGFIARNGVRAPVGVSIILQVADLQTKIPARFPGARYERQCILSCLKRGPKWPFCCRPTHGEGFKDLRNCTDFDKVRVPVLPASSHGTSGSSSAAGCNWRPKS